MSNSNNRLWLCWWKMWDHPPAGNIVLQPDFLQLTEKKVAIFIKKKTKEEVGQCWTSFEITSTLIAISKVQKVLPFLLFVPKRGSVIVPGYCQLISQYAGWGRSHLGEQQHCSNLNDFIHTVCICSLKLNEIDFWNWVSLY